MEPIRTKDDLEALINNQIEESAELEYKSAAALGRSDGRKKEITKDVSSLANAAGGSIIYGISEKTADPKGPGMPTSIDPVDAKEFSKEWLDQIVGQIQPRIPGLIISPIHVGPDQSDYVYVIDVPQGSTAHQALDHRYYARRNFEATPMVDYEVRDVMHRQIHPTVDAEIRIVADYPVDKRSHIAVRVKNTGKIMARHFAVVFRIPIRNSHGFIFSDAASMKTGDGPAYLSFSFTNRGGTPLFPGSEVVFSEKFQHMQSLKPDPGATIESIEMALYADNMPRISLSKDFAEAHKQWT
jgi:hypothetical protein